MYSYTWDEETGGLLLNSLPLQFSKEPRPVYYKELDILGFDKYWNYAKIDTYPYMWAESTNYIYRGKIVAKVKGGCTYEAPAIEIVEDPEPSGAPLRFVDVPGMVAKNSDLLEKLAQDTIKNVYNTFMSYKTKVDVFYVAFSAGKDSVCAYDIVQRALPHNEFKVLFGDTMMEFSDTYRVVEQMEEIFREHEVEFLRAKADITPEESWNIFGPPAQTMRWCCSVHKAAPQINLLREYLGNPHFRGMAFTGIRGDESAARSEYDDVSLGEKIRGQYSCHPILSWNSAELYLYIYSRNLILNEAYKKGNTRAGCLVCPMANNKNIYIKEQCYSSGSSEYPTTTTFNDIILNTSAKELSTQSAKEEFMNIAGWKARRSGKELTFGENRCDESFENGLFKVRVTRQMTDWREWLKTVGQLTWMSNGNVEIIFRNNPYILHYEEYGEEIEFTVTIETHTKTDIDFMAAMKIVFRKAAYCIGCRVCEANCPNGFITMKDGAVHIDDRCVKCQKCHDVYYGCLVANSLRVPKGERKMGSIDRYGNIGIEYDWVKEYFEKKDEFWTDNSLGTNKIKNLKAFLEDSDVTVKHKFSKFGEVIDSIGIENPSAWALMLCNLVYTAEFNWWVKNINFSECLSQDAVFALLDDSMSETTRSHIVAAYKHILISCTPLSEEVGLGHCEYDIKKNNRYWNSVVRLPWNDADPLVILYSLYKFAEHCGSYYQFTLSRLLSHDTESDGISPTEIFGLNRENMEKILNGLSVNYPEFINASFTLDLDNITLRHDKTSADVLGLF